MTGWLARQRLTRGLRRLGHWPQWGREGTGSRYAACRDCGWAWEGNAIRGRGVAGTLRTTLECAGQG